MAATAISKGPAMSWRLIQGVPWPSPIEPLDLAPVSPLHLEKGGIKAVTSPATRMDKAEENERTKIGLALLCADKDADRYSWTTEGST